ncbi:aryl-sulfate sulfohydrolase [Persicitalea jodogahamensis]|uniref:Aryl-sulfate sulfohydrolase n=2 Tax=Persicitalea jodogahamensis TaxID=402147 RepID=A0A8J3G9P2_9BACT|nr:aryl-sulfate sulfohydrolase [Persicitalea jodogahamensis]
MALGLLVGSGSRPARSPLAMPPNIIFILTDDQGWTSLSSRMQNDLPESASDCYETPNIDRMARAGMRFTRGYAPAAICSPTRRSIQFGQTPIRQGEEGFPDRYKPGSNAPRALPQVLKAIDNRYQAAYLGKWDFRAEMAPEQFGYDLSDGDTRNGNGNLVQVKGDKWDDHYLTEDPKKVNSLTERAIGFMEKQAAAQIPFYLQISHYATHVNMETRQSTLDYFTKKKEGKRHGNPAWAGMLFDLDTGIGSILDKVEKLGIADHTYIFLMADNGATEFLPPVRNRLDHPSKFDQPMRNYPLRGGKWVLFEGGIRVPFIVMGPGIKAGSQSDVPVIGWDLLPTFAELAGGTARPEKDRDGGSFLSVLKNGGKGVVSRTTKDFYFHRYNNGYPHSAIISGNDKLVRFWKTGKTELYDLSKDQGEVTDLAAKNPKKAKELDARLLAYIKVHNPVLLTAYQGDGKKEKPEN